MKIRITKPTVIKGKDVFPGKEAIEVEDHIGMQLVRRGRAVEVEVEEKPAPKGKPAGKAKE